MYYVYFYHQAMKANFQRIVVQCVHDEIYVLVDEVMKLYEFSFVPSVHQYLLKSHSIKEICL